MSGYYYIVDPNFLWSNKQTRNNYPKTQWSRVLYNVIVAQLFRKFLIIYASWTSDELWTVRSDIRLWSSVEFGTVCIGISTWSCDELCSHVYSYTYKTPMNLWVPWNLGNFLTSWETAYQEGRCCVTVCVCWLNVCTFLRNLHGYTVHQWYQTFYSPTNAHVEFIKTN